MNQVLLLEIKHKALSLQIAQQKARLRIHTTLALLGLTMTAPSLNNLHSLQQPPVIVEEQPAQPAEEERGRARLQRIRRYGGPCGLSGWVTTHNATVELKAAYEAHRNTYGESHSTPSYAHHTPSYSTAEHDAGEAF